MFNSDNNRLINKEAIDLVISKLPEAVSMDSIEGKNKPYDINWNGLKLIVNVARPSLKKSFRRVKWYFALRERDHEIADFIVLFCLFEDKIEAIYVIPQVFTPKAYITISKLDGNMRYSFFRAKVDSLPDDIMRIKGTLPKLIKISKEARSLSK